MLQTKGATVFHIAQTKTDGSSFEFIRDRKLTLAKRFYTRLGHPRHCQRIHRTGLLSPRRIIDRALFKPSTSLNAPVGTMSWYYEWNDHLLSFIEIAFHRRFRHDKRRVHASLSLACFTICAQWRVSQ